MLPALAEEPPVLVDWLPWNHIFGGTISFGIEAGLSIGAPMATAIEQIVNIFVSLGNRRRLEDMKLERERAAGPAA